MFAISNSKSSVKVSISKTRCIAPSKASPVQLSKFCRSELNLGVEHSGFTLVKSGRYYDPTDPYILVSVLLCRAETISYIYILHRARLTNCVPVPGARRAAIMCSSFTRTSRRTSWPRAFSTSPSLRTVC